jgi:hypothetical protein
LCAFAQTDDKLLTFHFPLLRIIDGWQNQNAGTFTRHERLYSSITDQRTFGLCNSFHKWGYNQR